MFKEETKRELFERWRRKAKRKANCARKTSDVRGGGKGCHVRRLDVSTGGRNKTSRGFQAIPVRLSRIWIWRRISGVHAPHEALLKYIDITRKIEESYTKVGTMKTCLNPLPGLTSSVSFNLIYIVCFCGEEYSAYNIARLILGPPK
jgi:hypothetical protein